MRTLALLALTIGALPGQTQAARQDRALATLENLFGAMKAHDATAARAVFIPEARIVAVRPDGGTTQTTGDDFAARLPSIKEAIVERIWSPRLLSDGRMMQVWAEYDFHREGKLHHCGVNSVSLVETPEGWKIAAIVYTVQTENCPASPLGPLAGQ